MYERSGLEPEGHDVASFRAFGVELWRFCWSAYHFQSDIIDSAFRTHFFIVQFQQPIQILYLLLAIAAFKVREFPICALCARACVREIPEFQVDSEHCYLY